MQAVPLSMPPPLSRASTSARAPSEASSVHGGDKAKEEGEGDEEEGLCKDNELCETYWVEGGNRKKKTRILNAVLVKHEVIITEAASHHHILLKRMVNPEKTRDVLPPQGSMSVPADVRSFSVWFCVPTGLKDVAQLHGAVGTQRLSGLQLDFNLKSIYPFQRMLAHPDNAAVNVNAVMGFGYACGLDKIMYANVTIIPGAEWRAVPHSDFNERLNSNTWGANKNELKWSEFSMPRPLLFAPEEWDVVKMVGNMLFSSIVPHVFKNNWVPAALGIVHIAVVGRLHHYITCEANVMSGMLLLSGDKDTGKSMTMQCAHWLHGMTNAILGADSSLPGVKKRQAQIGGLAAVCWDDVTAETWPMVTTFMRTMPGGAGSVRVNTHGTYNAENYTSVAISVRRTRSPPRHVHAPACAAPSS
jgi:hypothetical protein